MAAIVEGVAEEIVRSVAMSGVIAAWSYLTYKTLKICDKVFFPPTEYCLCENCSYYFTFDCLTEIKDYYLCDRCIDEKFETSCDGEKDETSYDGEKKSI